MTNGIFLGNALNGIDAKNRVSVPASFRDVVAARSDERTIVLAPAERADCLIGYDQTHAAKVRMEVERRFSGNYSEERDDYIRATFGSAEKLAFDDNGRIILSPILKDVGAIDRLALFWGMGDYFEIWNPQLFVERPKLDTRVVRIVQRLLDTRASA